MAGWDTFSALTARQVDRNQTYLVCPFVCQILTEVKTEEGYSADIVRTYIP